MAVTAFQTNAFQRTAFQAPIVIAESISSTATMLSRISDTCQKLEYLASELSGIGSTIDAVAMSESVLVEIVASGDIITPSSNEENPQTTAIVTSSSLSVVAMAEAAKVAIQGASNVSTIRNIVENALDAIKVIATATDRVINYLVDNVHSLAYAEGATTDSQQAKETILSMVAARSSTIEIANFIEQISSSAESQSTVSDKLVIPKSGIVYTLPARDRSQAKVFMLRPINKIFTRLRCSL